MNWWNRLVNEEHPDSPQLLTVALAAVTLPAVLVAVGAACVYRIARHGDIGSGACWALGLSVVALAILAGFADKIKTIGASVPFAGGASMGSVETSKNNSAAGTRVSSGGVMDGSVPGTQKEGEC